MKVEQFENLIESLFSKDFLEGFDDDYGFTYKTDKAIKNIGYATNLSLETIDEAAKHHVDFMLTHHDAWSFVFGLKEECMKKLKEHQISHFFIHGPLDFIDFGTCTSLMNVLGIDDVKKFARLDKEEFPAIGEFSEGIPFSSLVTKMKNALQEPVRSWQHHQGNVKRIGVMTGAGHSSSLLKKALNEGCDTYVTGETILYTIQYAKFIGMNLIVGSHTFTEIFGIESLAKKTKAAFPDIQITRLQEEHFELNH